MFLIKKKKGREPPNIDIYHLPQVPGCKKERTSLKTTSTSPKCMEHFSIPKGDRSSFLNEYAKDRKEFSKPNPVLGNSQVPIYSSDDSKHILAFQNTSSMRTLDSLPYEQLFSMDKHFQSQHATRIIVELVRNKTSQARQAWHLLSDDG
jgi:hypothetical protein